MRMALTLAERGRGATRPDPVVGAVVVKGGRVIGRGHQERAGGPPAERAALDRIGPGAAAGATLYVTLEPRRHTARSGPGGGTSAIIQAGVARVVVGCRDLAPRADGRGLAHLRRAGIAVDVGCLAAECHTQNRAFFRWLRDRRPWVTLKVATTLDGFIAGPPGGRRRGQIQWITGPEARAHAHELRAAHDAILVGAGTVLADDPRLTVRGPAAAAAGAPRQPLRVVLDGRLRMPPTARLLGEAGETLVIGRRQGRRDAGARAAAALGRAGAEVLRLPGRADGTIGLDAVLRALAARGVQSLLVEGGSQVIGAFLRARLVDGVAWFVAPRLAGGGVPIVQGGRLDGGSPIALGPLTTRTVGEDLLITADVLAPDRKTPGPDSRRD
jgi:diaminohydroxyphosphoribosylaminopyrimidine deaminase / 5-amino-6-(5-phosphoribosylamino)uracil reductase